MKKKDNIKQELIKLLKKFTTVSLTEEEQHTPCQCVLSLEFILIIAQWLQTLLNYVGAYEPMRNQCLLNESQGMYVLKVL